MIAWHNIKIVFILNLWNKGQTLKHENNLELTSQTTAEQQF